jgi:predicted transposase/invertase (TIGR01784 family)
VLQNINEYLYKRYGEYQTIEEEVHHMVKTLYDPRIKQEGIKEGIKEGELKVAKRLLDKGWKVNEVAEVTDLSIEEIQILQT